MTSTKETEKAKRPPSIYIAIPTCRDWKAGFASSMLALVSKLTTDYHQGLISGLHVNNQVSSLLPWGRQLMLDDALSTENFTHILWIDDDTKFSTKAVDSLISRELPFVACNMCRKQIGDEGIACGEDGKGIDSAGKTGVEEVSRTGLGMVLMEIEMLRKLKKPHFEILWLEERQCYLGEDDFLCGLIREAGYKLYIDHDASRRVGHIGDYEYKFRSLAQLQATKAA